MTDINLEKVKQILKGCDTLELDEISYMIQELREMYDSKYESMYKEVYVYPGKIIVKKIMSETGYACIHRPVEGYSMGRGTHIIIIPIDQYTDSLRNELIDKYNNL